MPPLPWVGTPSGPFGRSDNAALQRPDPEIPPLSPRRMPPATQHFGESSESDPSGQTPLGSRTHRSGNP